MKKVLSCFKCSLAFPDLPVGLGFHCSNCGTELEIVRPLSKREAERMRLNLAGQKLAHQNPLNSCPKCGNFNYACVCVDKKKEEST